MRSLLVAIRFLTVLPVSIQGRVQDEELGGSLVWFPLVGLLIGSLVLLVQQMAGPVLPPLVVGALMLLVWVAVTGAIHLDGLADTCDGLYGGRTPAERLRIMKDPHVGAMGVVAIGVMLITKFALLASVPYQTANPGIWLAPCVGRWAMVFLGTTMPYARSEPGLAAPFVRYGRRSMLLGATVMMLFALWLGAGFSGLFIIGAGVAMTLLLRAIFRAALGGIAGDALGASGEIVEAITLVTAECFRGL